MFDIGFLEMMVIGVLALIVLGPERLPGAIKSCVQTVRSIKDMANGFKQEVSAQIDAHELHANLKEAEKLGMQNLGKELKESVEELKSAAESVQRPYKKDPQALAEKLTPQIGDDDDSQAVSSLTGLPIAQDPEPQADFDDYQHNDNDFLQNSDGSLAPTDIDHKDTASTEGSVSHSENEQHELPETPLSDTPMQHSLDIDSPLPEPLNEKSKNHE